jgi:CHAD domain-containing protein
MTAIIFEQSGDSIARSSKSTHFVAAIPPHIEQASWLDFQKSTELLLCDSVSQELAPLSKKPTEKRVHETRVALRRWFSVWAVLKEDGWSSKKINKKVVSKLRKLLKALGNLRDLDVNIELGKTFGCPQSILAEWDEQQRHVRRKVRSRIDHLEPAVLLMRLRNYLNKRYVALRDKNANSSAKPVSTYYLLDRYVCEQEMRVKELESAASTPEELHKLRLAIKRWRYLLTEFFGLTNLQLVRAQQLLGRLNDYQRIEKLLIERQLPELNELTEKIKTERQRLIEEFATVREELPYGLRPVVISSESAAPIKTELSS